jgi:hypothetical protein
MLRHMLNSGLTHLACRTTHVQQQHATDPLCLSVVRLHEHQGDKGIIATRLLTRTNKQNENVCGRALVVDAVVDAVPQLQAVQQHLAPE